MEHILGSCYQAAPWVAKLKEIASRRWNIYDNVAISESVPAARNASLDCIIQAHFGIKKPFLKKPKIYGYFLGGEPELAYDYFTKAGGKAYGKLIQLVYDLGNLFGVGFDTCRIVDVLDDIVTSDCY